MARGRKRVHSPHIPKHIDQARIPAGFYFDHSGRGRWYVLDPKQGGGTRKKTVATSEAKLSDLHAIAEQRAGNDARGTIGFIIGQFHSRECVDFQSLMPRTRQNYDRQAEIVRAYRLTTGATLDTLAVDRLPSPVLQRIVGTIAGGKPESRPGAGDAVPGKPTKANHLLRYLRLLFSYGMRNGLCTTNPAKGVRQAKERKRHGMPEAEAFDAVLGFARERGALKAHTAGSVAPYIAHVMVIAYACRLRMIEAVTLTDANALPDGILSNRRKGSRDNVTRWTPELRAAWSALVELRAAAWGRRHMPIPLRPESRPLVVSQDGDPLRKSSLDTSWQRLIIAAIKAEVIEPGQRFTLHGIKHRGITDSADKRSGGHKTEAMRQRYDHDVPVVDPAKRAEFSGDHSGGEADASVSD